MEQNDLKNHSASHLYFGVFVDFVLCDLLTVPIVVMNDDMIKTSKFFFFFVTEYNLK